MKARVAYVKWLDSTKHNGQFSQKDIPGLITLETVGFLVARNKRYITLAVDRQKVDGEWRDIVEIPIVNLIEVRTIRPRQMKLSRRRASTGGRKSK